MRDKLFPYAYGPSDQDVMYTCPKDEACVHVRVTTDNQVTMVFFENIKWLSVTPKIAFRIAYLLIKYAILAWLGVKR